MAATTRVVVFHEAGPTQHPLDTVDSFVNPAGHIRFKRADNSLKDTANPIPIPTSGTNYSWRKHTKLEVTAAPPTEITNLRWFSDGAAIATGVTKNAATVGSYTQGAVGDETADVISGADAATYTSGSPLTVNAGTVIGVATGFGTQDFVAQQMAVASTASSGSTPDKTYTYRYDES